METQTSHPEAATNIVHSTSSSSPPQYQQPQLYFYSTAQVEAYCYNAYNAGLYQGSATASSTIDKLNSKNSELTQQLNSSKNAVAVGKMENNLLAALVDIYSSLVELSDEQKASIESAAAAKAAAQQRDRRHQQIPRPTVRNLTASSLNDIFSENAAAKQERDQLRGEVENLRNLLSLKKGDPNVNQVEVATSTTTTKLESISSVDDELVETVAELREMERKNQLLRTEILALRDKIRLLEKEISPEKTGALTNEPSLSLRRLSSRELKVKLLVTARQRDQLASTVKVKDQEIESLKEKLQSASEPQQQQQQQQAQSTQIVVDDHVATQLENLLAQLQTQNEELKTNGKLIYQLQREKDAYERKYGKLERSS